MLLFGIIVVIVVNAGLVVNMRLFKLYYPKILAYDIVALAIYLILALYQVPKPPNYITTNSGKKYTIGEISDNALLYTDRVYRFTKVPDELSGAMFIQTANDDKASNQENLFSLTVNCGAKAVVYYFFDKRLYPNQGPGWLGNKKTQAAPNLASTDRDAEFVMVADTLKPGLTKIFFGGNQPGTDNKGNKSQVLCSMYLVAIKGVNADQIVNTNETKANTDQFDPLVYGEDSGLLGKQARDDHFRWIKYGPKHGHRLDLLGSEQIWNTTCFNADFQAADLSKTSIDSTAFNSSVLNDVEFSHTQFADVNFFNTHVDGANFSGATLKNCSFLGSSIRGAIFTDVTLDNVNFACADMAGVVFEPNSVNNVQEIASAYNLDSMTYRTNPGALIKLKEQLRGQGFTAAQRKITAAIQRRKLELSTSWITRWVSWLFFDFTSAYGLNPFQPLLILLASIYLFYRLYLFLFFIQKLEVTIKHKKEDKDGSVVTVNDSLQPGRLLFLSIITSFSIGFGPYNLNDWAKKLLKEDYTLQSRGWTRILIGAQNLISLYLFALTVLLLFGDPFNF